MGIIIKWHILYLKSTFCFRRMNRFFYLFLFIFFLPYVCIGQGNNVVLINDAHTTLIKGEKISFYEDFTNSLTLEQIKNETFSSCTGVPNFGFSKSTYWFKFKLLTKSNQNNNILRIDNPNIDSVTIFISNKMNEWKKISSGLSTNFSERRYNTSDILFHLDLLTDVPQVVYLKVRTKNNFFIPIYVGKFKQITASMRKDANIVSLFLGVILIMIVYNLFLAISTKDKAYFLYILYLISILYTQISLKGLGYQYLWNLSTFFTNKSIVLSGAISGIFTILFTKQFLALPQTLPRINKIINVFIVLDVLGIVLSFFSYYLLSFQIVNIVAILGCLIILTSALLLIKKGDRSAVFFFLAYSFFLVSVIIYVLRLYGVIPLTIVTRYILLIGSTLEVALLSFALADKINMYRREKDRSYHRMLQAVKEKEEFVRAQNLLLEEKVQNRTEDLEHANNELHQVNSELNVALEHQKRAEGQLIQAEKMASLGRITAGIAHEINNPINFIQSNIGSLDLDVKELLELLGKYKEITKDNIEEKLREIRDFAEDIELDTLYEEIPMLLTGMKEGTTRTASIVSGLRVFSRLDEDALKKTDIHLGIDSTIRLLHSMTPKDLEIVKKYNEIPLVECNPGKLNQVFMNLIANAIQALSSVHDQRRKRITITTAERDSHVVIKIADNGSGIPLDIQDKIFEPFFTTKEVGEGTGLGLSLVFSIIQKHNGTIKVYSKVDEGSEFTITLPIEQSNLQEDED